MSPEVQEMELGAKYYHARFRDPDEFETIRTPDWASHAADSVSKGSEVRMGKKENSDDWSVEAVLIPEDESESDAREKAKKIVEKIEP